jgi:multimeric flavodoxin WrbA
MKITILNGNPNPDDTSFEAYLQKASQVLGHKSHVINLLNIRDMEIKYCVGCFGCWVKKPGECLFPDDSIEVRRASINSHLLLCASPVIMGFTSAVLKRAMDKMIPLIHPYMVIDQGEVHHRRRYKTYPRMALLLQPGKDTDQEDLEIIEQSYRRLAINFKTSLAFTHLTIESVQELIDEINRV